MKRTRENLQGILEEILGSENVYFQPSENLKLTYPCIVYNLENADAVRANDSAYLWNMRYLVTIITKDPDSDIWKKMCDRFQYCDLDRTGRTDNLHHFYLTLYW